MLNDVDNHCRDRSDRAEVDDGGDDSGGSLPSQPERERPGKYDFIY